jgi:hypothetical protein
MLKWLKKTWRDARSSVLRDEFDQSVAHLAQFDASQRLECYRTVVGAVDRLVAQVGPIERLSDAKKKQLATMLSGLARELFASKPVRAYATAFVSMWLESQTFPGDDAEYVRLQSSEFIESTLRGYEEEQSRSPETI